MKTVTEVTEGSPVEALGTFIVVISIVFVLASSVVSGRDSRETMLDDRIG